METLIHGFSNAQCPMSNAVEEYRQGRGIASVAFAKVRRSTSTEVRKDLLKRSGPELFVSENLDKAFRPLRPSRRMCTPKDNAGSIRDRMNSMDCRPVISLARRNRSRRGPIGLTRPNIKAWYAKEGASRTPALELPTRTAAFFRSSEK